MADEQQEAWGVNDPVAGPQPTAGAQDDWGVNDPVAPPAGYALDAARPPAGYAVDAPQVPRNNFVFSRAPGGGTGTSLKNTPQETFLDNTSIGRVLDAFGQGAKQGWGAQPLGLSPESEKALRDIGIYNSLEEQGYSFTKGFNEVLIRPAAAVFDAVVLRAVPAAIHGTAEAIGQTAEEFGATHTEGQQLTRDSMMLADVLGVMSGEAAFMGAAPKVRGASAAVSRAQAVAKDTARAFDVAEEAAAHIPTPAGAIKPAMPSLEPPPSAVSALPKLESATVDRAGNINLDRIAAPEDVKDVIREVAEANGGFTDARRGVVNLAQTEEMAYALGMTPEQLLKRKIGEAFNAEEATAASNLLVQSAVKVRELAIKAQIGSDAEKLAYAEAAMRHTAIQEQVAGMTAEAGRALSAFRIMRQGTQDAKQISDLIKQQGGFDRVAETARLIAELDTPQQVSRFLMDARKATTSDMLVEAWINGLLSGPQTLAANGVGSVVTSLWRLAETGTAAGIGGLRAMAGSEAERVMFGEIGAKVFGYVQGAKEGIHVAWRTFRTEIPSDGLNKLEQRKFQAIPSAKVGDIEIGGKQIRIPSRILMATDEFAKAIARRQAVNALTYRQAATEGLRGDAFTARLAELRANPSDDIMAKAGAEADYQTFTKPLGEMGQAVQKFVNSHPALKLVIPFVRTPANIVKFAGERTPLGLFSKEVRDVLAGSKGAAARDDQIAKLLVGSAIGTTAATLAAQGKITGGGPKDPAERAMLRMTGWQPYSVKIGEFYYSYARLEPLATIMGIAADGAEIAHKMEEPEAEGVAGLVVASLSKNLISKTWLKGASDLISAIDDPDRYGGQYVAQLLGTVIPTGVAQAARAEDPYLRDAQTILDTIKARVPGWSKTLMPKRDLFGHPIERDGSVGPDIVSPIYQSAIEKDPVARELVALEVFPAKLDRQVRGVDLTPQQYDDFQRTAGVLTYMMLKGAMGMPGWDDVPEYARRDVVMKTVTRARDTARSYMLMKYPQITVDAMRMKVKRLTGQ